MTEETQKQSTALALNTQEIADKLMEEVQAEFLTSDREVYKAGLRSLLIQEQKLLQQKASIDADIRQLNEARNALSDAFKSGQLHSVSDARGVVRKVNQKINVNDFDTVDEYFK